MSIESNIKNQKQEFIESETGKIPEDWEEKTFSEAINVNPKRKLKKRINATFVSMAGIKEFDKKIHGFTIKKFSGESKYINWGTLMARISPRLENGKTAMVSFLDDGEIAFGSTEFIVFASKIIPSSLYIFCLTRSENVREIAIGAMTGSSGRQMVPNECFDHLLVSAPPHYIIKDFDNIFRPMFEVISTNAKENQSLIQISDIPLLKLMSGKIRVKCWKRE